MIIDFISDLHMEINSDLFLNIPDQNGDVLILCGDITCYRYFQEHRTDKPSRSMINRFTKLIKETFGHYKKIIYIPGNHEYYGFYFLNADIWFAQKLQEIDNRCILLNRSDPTFVYSDVAIIGSTLWTDIKNGDPLIELAVQEGMNDYKQITHKKDSDLTYADKGYTNLLRAQTTMLEYFATLKAIKGCYEVLKDNFKIVVATHHAPSFQSHDYERFRHDSLTYAYCSDLDEFIENTNIHTWIHGHTHHNINYKIGNTQILSAMHGYVGYDNRLTRSKHNPLTIGRIVV